jgi:uncharacterized protein YjbI with pentapeptide repeats/tetratricopeptide (TPR) repeat protein
MYAMGYISDEKLSQILKEHKRWCDTDEDEGEKADLSDANLREADLSKADLREANLSGADLTEAYLNDADLSKADLSKVDLSKAELGEKANLNGACLRCAYLGYTDLRCANLNEADLSGAVLSGANLSGANLRGADLRDADLNEADLGGADLEAANLECACLSGANLSRASLSGSNLSFANLSKVNLRGADLSGADLSDTNLKGANLLRVRGLTMEQLSSVETLCDAELSSERIKQVRKKYPHLLEKLEEEDYKITLCSSYRELSVSQIKRMSTVFIKKDQDYGDSDICCHSTINHDYNPKTIKGDKVVVDNTTGLMWHQSGSGRDVWGIHVWEWVKDLNSEEGYAGYRDWRMPTVEEAVSLLESSKKNGDLCIDPVFSKKQDKIWTGDKMDDEDSCAWYISTFSSIVSADETYDGDMVIFVRPVRTVLSNDSDKELAEEDQEEEEELRKPEIITLRSSHNKKLSVSQMESMSNECIRIEIDSKQMLVGHSTIIHNYNLITLGDDKVVVDYATGLMWHQSGSDAMEWNKAKEWIKKLNKRGYAGYNDWRLPTLEEAVSLLESNWDDLYIDHVFSKEQRLIWTGDSRSHMEDVWSVDFDSGYVFCSLRCSCVRPVRSVLDNDSGGEPEEEVYEEVEVLEDEGHEEEDTIIEQYKQAIRINPDDAEAHFLLGVTYTNLKMYKKSIESFKQVIRIDPGCAGAHNNIGLAYCELGKYEESIESYKQAIRIDHDLAVAHSSLGKAYIVLGKYEESIESSKQAIRINPDDASAHSNIGLAYGELGKNEESIELYKQAIRLDPDLAVSHFLLGNAYGRLDKWKEAIESYKQAISIDPDDANAHYSLGTAYFLLMDRDSAFEQYKILEKLDTEKANKLFNLFNR